MSSVRQKESKIPLKMDSKLKNISKIPLRVKEKTTLTQPKIIVEPDLKKTSAANRNKKTTNEVRRVKNSNFSSQVLQDRIKTTAKEIPQKRKPAEQKENMLRSSDKKIPEKKMLTGDPFKTSIKEKQIKNSNHPSHILKDRNKTSTKEISQKCKPAEQKEKPLCSFEKGFSKMNMLDEDPFKTSTEEKQIKNANHPSQQDIEFVADERMKKLILSNRELSPSILKLCSNRKTSSMMDRPSMYKKCNQVPVDPYKQALVDIAKSDLASEGRRVSEMQKNRLYLSPLQNRNSLYKHSKFVGDPYQEALKSIAELRMHQKIKSCKKKVTFNLSGDDQSANSEVKYINNEEKPLATIQPQLTERSEENSGNSNPFSPKLERNMLLTPGNNPSIKVTFDSFSGTDEISEDQQINKKVDSNQLENKTDFIINDTIASASSLKAASNNEEILYDSSPILHKQKIDKYASIFNHEIRNSIMKTTVNPFLNSVRTSDVRQSLFSSQSERFFDKMNPKIFTPQPVSFYPRTRVENISPEFLSRRTTDILSCAPINTPLVLRSLGQQELSPVCKRLEFKDSPKESKKEASDSRENSQTFYLQNIMTQQKILDQLAHQECSIFMHEAEFPCEIRENLENPIARILNNGDEMHFVPLWRLS